MSWYALSHDPCSPAHQNFDLILSQSRLEKACYELAAFVDAYLTETSCAPEYNSRVEQLLVARGL